MPTYDYECGDCGIFEATHGIDFMLELCQCGQPVRRLISRVQVLIPDVHKAGYWDDRRLKNAFTNNTEGANMIANGTAGDPIISKDVPGEVRADFESKVAAVKGKTRLGY